MLVFLAAPARFQPLETGTSSLRTAPKIGRIDSASPLPRGGPASFSGDPLLDCLSDASALLSLLKALLGGDLDEVFGLSIASLRQVNDSTRQTLGSDPVLCQHLGYTQRRSSCHAD